MRTIEAAVIVPIFTIIVLEVIIASIECHDRVIINCASDKVCMNFEFYELYQDNYLEIKNEYETAVNGYIREKTIYGSENYSIDVSLLAVKTDISNIDKNNPVEFVRVTNAAINLMERE